MFSDDHFKGMDFSKPPEKTVWWQLCQGRTISEISELTGRSKSILSRWANAFQLWPPFRCRVCGKVGERITFETYKRCLDCLGKTTWIPKPPPQDGGKREPVQDMPLPATAGPLTYWQQRGLWMLGEEMAE